MRSARSRSDATSASGPETMAGDALARRNDTVKVKVVPPPRRCATTMSPPIARASAFTDDNPRPAPPKREAMLTLACENGRNRRLISCSVRPIPLSETAKATPILPFVPRTDLTASATPPCSVNLTALSIRFSSAARSRTGSPITKAGSFSEISTEACNPLAAARPASESPALRASARKSKKSCRTASAEPPLRAASTNKVARLARCSAPALMVSTQRRSRSSRPDVASRSLMARMPVSGVRTSCANAANAASTMPGATVLTARLRALPAAIFGARFFSVRLGRCERDFDAMIPPTRPPPACHGRLSGVTPKRISTCDRTPAKTGQLRQADEGADFGRRCPPGAELAQTGGGGRFRTVSPGIVTDETGMPIGRLRQSEQLLQQPMQAGRPEQILAPHHLGHALQGVVDDHREVIAGRRLLARQDDVAPRLRPGGHRAGLPIRTFAAVGPAEVTGARA